MIREEINQEIDKILKSNSSILKILMSNNLMSIQENLKEIVKHKTFQEKIKLLLNFYKARGNEDSSILDRSKLLNNSLRITEVVKKLITNTADNLNLNLNQTLDLVDLYFQSHYEYLERLLKKEEFMKLYDQDPSVIQTFTKSNIHEFRHNFEVYIQMIQDEISIFYFDERINLLKLCYMFISISFNDRDPIASEFKNIFEMINKNNQFLRDIWKAYLMYTKDFKIMKDMIYLQSRDRHSWQILNEQTNILDILMLMCIKIDTSAVFEEIFLEILETFSRQKFMGYYSEIVNEPHVGELKLAQEKLAWIIIDLCVLLIINNMDLKYLFYYDNKIPMDNILGEAGKTTSDRDQKNNTISTSAIQNKMPLMIFTNKNYLEKFIIFFESNIQNNHVKPIFMAFYSIYNYINENINNMNNRDDILLQINKYKERINNIDRKCNPDESLEFLNGMFGRLIFSQDRASFHSFYTFIIKFWLNITIKYYFNYEHTVSLIDLCVKTLNSDINRMIFWNVDHPYKTPLARIFENLIDDFPNDFDLMLKFCHALQNSSKSRPALELSDNLFYRLMNMQYYNLTCSASELQEISESNEINEENDLKINKLGLTQVVLLSSKNLKYGIHIPQGTIGLVRLENQGISQSSGRRILNVRFRIDFSIFSLVYNYWSSLLDTLYEMPIPNVYMNSNNNFNELINSEGNENRNNIKFIELFCSFLSVNRKYLEAFFTLINTSDYLNEEHIILHLNELLVFSFKTISLLVRNWQLYSYLLPLSNSIYSMIESFLHNSRINPTFMKVIINHFIISGDVDMNDRSNLSHSFMSHYLPDYNRLTQLNLIEIFANTLKFDFSRKNYRNTNTVLRIIKNFFKYPNILEFCGNINSTDFLYHLWLTIVVELIKSINGIDHLNSREEFNMCKELVKIVYYNYRNINYSKNKANIISAVPNVPNILFELTVSCLNTVDTVEFILKILRTKIILNENESSLKDKISLRNIFWDKFVSSGNNFYIDKILAKDLMRVSFKCLNEIFDLLLFYKSTEREQVHNGDYNVKNYYRIDSIKNLDELIFVNKQIPEYEISITRDENYTINLIFSVFSYIDFEGEEMLDYLNTRRMIKDEEITSENEDNDSESAASTSYSYHKISSVEKLVYFKRQTEKDFNICTLALSTLTRILNLLKYQTFDNAIRKQSKASNLLNYLNIRKEMSNELENNINMTDRVKQTLYIILYKSSEVTFKIEIIKFLIECGNSQTGFLNIFLEEIKLKNIKIRKFWEIFAILVNQCVEQISSGNAPSKGRNPIITKYCQLLGYLSIFISKLFSIDGIFKKIIREFLSNYHELFSKFLNTLIDVYSLNSLENNLQKTRETFEKNIDEFRYEGNNIHQFLYAEDDIDKACFENVVVGSIAKIFVKLIITSDDNFEKVYNQGKFTFNKEIMKFLNTNISNFIELFNSRMNYDFVNQFNSQLADERNFLNYNNDSKLYPQQRGLHSSVSSKINNMINIMNIEKSLHISDSDKSLSKNEYLNYWVDLKELYIIMKIKNYNMDIFYDYLTYFIAYNLELALFDTKVQTMHSVSYLIGLILSIGYGGAFLSTYLFTGIKTAKCIERSAFNKDFGYYYLQLHKTDFPKLNFKISQSNSFSLSEFVKFADDKVIKRLQLDLDSFVCGNKIDKCLGTGLSINEFNFYNQYITCKYNILNYIVDYAVFLYQQNITTSSSFPKSTFQKNFVKFLGEIDRVFGLFINNIQNIQVESCILSIINLIYSILNYLISTEYEFNNSDIDIVNSLIYSLLVCFDKVEAYQAIIIFILNAYANLNFFKCEKTNSTKNLELNILFNSDDNRIIRSLLKKLSMQISEQEYLAIITLLITLVDNYSEFFDMLVREKILLVFQLNDKFSQTNAEIPAYQDNERAVNHVLWCWTLIFFRQVCLRIQSDEAEGQGQGQGQGQDMRYNSVYHSIVEFLINHEVRVLHILSDTDYIDQSGNHMNKSLAFLEELEYLTCLLNVLFMQAKKWKNSSQNHLDFHHRFVTVILSKTLKLYVPNIKISNHYKFLSNAEKMMSEIYPGEEHFQGNNQGIQRKDEHYTSCYSPTRKTFNPPSRNSIDNVMSPRRDFTRGNISYNPKASSLFFYRIDNCLNKILYNLTNIVKSATTLETFSNKNSYSNYIKENYSSRNHVSNQSIKIFDDQCQNLIYAVYFAYHSLESMIKNFENIEKLHQMSTIFFGNINASVNFGNLNLIYEEGDFEDIFHINDSTLQNLLLINATFYQFISYFRSTLSYTFDNQLKDITLRKLDPILKAMKERDSKVAGFKNIGHIYENLSDYVKRKMD